MNKFIYVNSFYATATPNPWAPLLPTVSHNTLPTESSPPSLAQASKTFHANHIIHKQTIHWKEWLRARHAERKQQQRRDKQLDIHNFCSIISQHLCLLDQAKPATAAHLKTGLRHFCPHNSTRRPTGSVDSAKCASHHDTFFCAHHNTHFCAHRDTTQAL